MKNNEFIDKGDTIVFISNGKVEKGIVKGSAFTGKGISQMFFYLVKVRNCKKLWKIDAHIRGDYLLLKKIYGKIESTI